VERGRRRTDQRRRRVLERIDERVLQILERTRHRRRLELGGDTRTDTSRADTGKKRTADHHTADGRRRSRRGKTLRREQHRQETLLGAEEVSEPFAGVIGQVVAELVRLTLGRLANLVEFLTNPLQRPL